MSKRIHELAGFFYSTKSIKKVPCRISLRLGEFSGSDLTKDGFVNFMNLLAKSKNLRNDLKSFIQAG